MTGINDDLTSYADRLTRLLDAADEAREQERLQAVTLYADRLGVQLDLAL